jgi:hypothetical protein
VSAILKALRRVENESVRRDETGNETPPTPKKLDPKKAIRDQYKKNWTLQRLLMVLLPLLTLAIAGWVVISYKPFLLPESSTAAVKSTNSTSPLSEPSVKVDEPVLEDRRKRSETATPSVTLAQEKHAPSKALTKKEKKTTPDSATGEEEGPSARDPEFKLQAIVWSEVPESRFAVINGVIVRAGGMIEGVSVTEIGRDYVSFRSGPRTWKMKITTE